MWLHQPSSNGGLRTVELCPSPLAVAPNEYAGDAIRPLRVLCAVPHGHRALRTEPCDVSERRYSGLIPQPAKADRQSKQRREKLREGRCAARQLAGLRAEEQHLGVVNKEGQGSGEISTPDTRIKSG